MRIPLTNFHGVYGPAENFPIPKRLVQYCNLAVVAFDTVFDTGGE